MRFRSNTNFIISCFFILGISFNNFSQPPTSPANGNPPAGNGPPSNGNGNPPCWDPQCIPIDGGLGFLIAAGAILGYKKIRKIK